MSELVPYDFKEVLKDINIDYSKYSDREKIEIIEWYLRKNFDDISYELPIKNAVVGGIYERELTIPQGVIVIGKVHTEPHKCFLRKGDLSVMTDDGIKRVQAPYSFDAPANIKKIGLSHTECVFSTYHEVNTENIKELEEKLFVDSDLSWVSNMIKDQIRLVA
jgi:hypothetical protein